MLSVTACRELKRLCCSVGLHSSSAIRATRQPDDDEPEALLTDAQMEQKKVLEDLAETLAGKDLDMEKLKAGTWRLQVPLHHEIWKHYQSTGTAYA